MEGHRSELDQDTRASYGAGTVTVLESSVIAPVLQSILPSTVEPVPSEFDAPARTLPLKLTLVPSVDEAKIAQYTFPALAPLISNTCALLFTVSDDPIWKIQTAFASPLASSVTVPPTATLMVDPDV